MVGSGGLEPPMPFKATNLQSVAIAAMRTTHLKSTEALLPLPS